MFEKDVLISITLLKLKPGLDKLFGFIWHAVGSMNQSKKANGNLYTSANRVNGAYMTISAWSDAENITSFMHKGSHKAAMKAFRWMATGKTYRYTSRNIPNWNDAYQLVLEHGRSY
jgi:heme-degrading monooxygenase HmoA